MLSIGLTKYENDYDSYSSIFIDRMDLLTEDTLVGDIDCDDLSGSGNMSSVDDERPQEYWNNEGEMDSDLDDTDERQLVGDNDSILRISLIFFMLWASFYGISASALNHLIKLLHYVFTILKKNVSTATEFLNSFPTSLYMLKKYLGFSEDAFVEFVICEKCGSLHTFKECFVRNRTGDDIPKLCNHIAFPNHPYPSLRKACSHHLLKEIRLKSSLKYSAIKAYCFSPLKTSFMNILQRKGYLDMCEQWRNRVLPDTALADIYDGAVWKEWMSYNGRPFLSQPYNLAVMLNCDWFQPFEHSCYSVGVLYLVILNLPRSMRFKPENIIIASIIPGPKEPNQTEMNSYLRPLVKELNALFTEGMIIKTTSEVQIFVALIASVCDLPATAKFGGFLSHNSHYGCWKCSKYFPYDKQLNRNDFSGVQVGLCREHAQHKANALSTLSCNTPTNRKEKELDLGSRFTELFHLKYYDTVHYAIIDPLHNLFLGTAKRLVHHWIEIGILSNSTLKIIQVRVDNFNTPSTVGRIPRKIQSGFSNMTADEWKNWTILYSLIAFHDILPPQHMVCWRLFAKACTILCSSVITTNEIDHAQQLLCDFFVSVENLHGSRYVTINTHLHLHYSQCLTDFGPCYGYWLFSFERYNGILGKYHTNRKAIEVQLMRTFLNDMYVRSLADTDIAPLHQAVFGSLLKVRLIPHLMKQYLVNNNSPQDICCHFLKDLSPSLYFTLIIHVYNLFRLMLYTS